MKIKEKVSGIGMALGAAVLSFLCSMSSIYFPLSHKLDFNDSAIYQYIGYLITKGKTPYVDAFDHKGIYFYLFNALGYRIDPKWGIWLLVWACMLLITLVIYHMSRRFVSRGYAVGIVLVTVSALGATFWEGNIPDFFAVLFNFAAFDVISGYFVKGDLSRGKLFLVGVVSAAAFWMKPNMIAGTLVVSGILVLYFLADKAFALIGRCLAFFAVGFTVGTVPAIAWLAAKGALPAMVNDYFLFNFTYSSFQATWLNRLNAFSMFCSQPVSYMALTCIVLSLLTLFHKGQDEEEGQTALKSRMLVCGIVSFIVCLFYAASMGNTYINYSMLLYPSVVMLLIAVAGRMLSLFPDKKVLIRIVAAAGVVVVLVFNTLQIIDYGKFMWAEIPLETEEIQYIRDNSQEGDTIASISPYNTGLYLATGRDSATPSIYIQLHHFVNMNLHPETESAFWQEYTQQLIEAKPRMIIYDTGYNGDDEMIRSILAACLDDYVYTGDSYEKEFYVLPYYEDEIIPDFVAENEIDTSLFDFRIPPDKLEAYKKGELTLDDMLAIFDENVTKKKR